MQSIFLCSLGNCCIHRWRFCSYSTLCQRVEFDSILHRAFFQDAASPMIYSRYSVLWMLSCAGSLPREPFGIEPTSDLFPLSLRIFKVTFFLATLPNKTAECWLNHRHAHIDHSMFLNWFNKKYTVVLNVLNPNKTFAQYCIYLNNNHSISHIRVNIKIKGFIFFLEILYIIT